MKNINQAMFIIIKKKDTFSKFILIAGQTKHKMIKVSEYKLLELFNPRIILVEDSKELRNIEKEYVQYFRDAFPELYI